jgi:hypothetical protein
MIVPSASLDVPDTEVIDVAVQYDPEIVGVAVTPPLTAYFTLAGDIHSVVSDALTVIESQGLKNKPDAVQAPPVVDLTNFLKNPLTYTVTTTLAMLSGAGIVPDMLVKLLVRGVVVTIGVEVVVVVLKQKGVSDELH